MGEVERSRQQVGVNTWGGKNAPGFFYTLKRLWFWVWNGSPPDIALFSISLIIAVLMAIPILYVVWRSFFAGADRWMRLLDARIPLLLKNTLGLAGAVTIMSVVIGVALAWIVHRSDLPGRNRWQWLLAMPLVIPPYVGAVTYIIIFGPYGWLNNIWGQTPINIYSFFGVFFVLVIFTYPYVFLVSSSALKRMNRNFEDAARSLGLGPFEVFRKVSLPLLRPAIGAGAILVSLYVLSDFGVISMLRYTTFTSAIYYQMGSYDTVSATVLSFVLIFLTMIILWLEGKTRNSQKFYQTSNTYRKPEQVKLGCFKIPALIFVLVVFFFSVLLPIIVLLYWSGRGIAAGAIDSRFWLYTLNSIKVAGLAAFACMVLALPLIYLNSRHASFLTTIISKLSYSGYALPGVIAALGIVFIFNQYIPWLYNSYLLLSIAYIIRFLPQSMQSGEASLSLISPRVDEAARSLGYSPIRVIEKVIIPLILPGLLAGGALVFVSSIKELPATLLLRPPGFDTLAVRVWVEASEAVYHLAAPAALIIISISMVSLKWMLSKY